jgi:ABC-type proline/glycine betaine transport system substrate-binding protein
VKRLSKIIGILFGSLFLLFLAALAVVLTFGTVEFSSSSTLKSGRTVKVTSDRWSGVDSQDSIDSTTLKMAGYKIVVTPKQLIVDGQPLAAIDAGVKTVAINDQKGEIKFTADGDPVASLRR